MKQIRGVLFQETCKINKLDISSYICLNLSVLRSSLSQTKQIPCFRYLVCLYIFKHPDLRGATLASQQLLVYTCVLATSAPDSLPFDKPSARENIYDE